VSVVVCAVMVQVWETIAYTTMALWRGCMDKPVDS
jgi:hypothetical protein